MSNLENKYLVSILYLWQSLLLLKSSVQQYRLSLNTASKLVKNPYNMFLLII